MKTNEPRIRRDGKCVQCKKSRPERAVKDGDPFCSTECAKTYHGVSEEAPPVEPIR